jgi:hypothetical protein
LKDELDGAWAVRPLKLMHGDGRTMLLLENRRIRPSAHINAIVMMLAERASDLIRGRPTPAPANV